MFRWQGAPNVLWANRQSLEYTELREHSHLHPHRFPALAADGTMAILDVICLPNEIRTSPDKPMAAMTDVLAEYVALGGFVQIAAPSDVHRQDLFDALRAMPSAERGDWTAADVADWWRRTHTDKLLITNSTNTFELTAVSPIDDLVVEILLPNGAITKTAVSLAPRTSTLISVLTGPGGQPLTPQVTPRSAGL
jgi:hypothetical protein